MNIKVRVVFDQSRTSIDYGMEGIILEGTVTWFDSGECVVDINNETIKEAVDVYLNTEREFKIPVSDRIDDYKVVEATPVDDDVYFYLGMSTLYANTGVYVNWDSHVKEE